MARMTSIRWLRRLTRCWCKAGDPSLLRICVPTGIGPLTIVQSGKSSGAAFTNWQLRLNNLPARIYDVSSCLTR